MDPALAVLPAVEVLARRSLSPSPRRPRAAAPHPTARRTAVKAGALEHLRVGTASMAGGERVRGPPLSLVAAARRRGAAAPGRAAGPPRAAAMRVGRPPVWRRSFHVGIDTPAFFKETGE